MKTMVTRSDTILFVVLIMLSIGSLLVASIFSTQGSTVLIEVKNISVYKGDLSEDRKVTIASTFGDVRIQIKDGKVAVVYADCPNKVCVRTGWRSRSGESIICVPNRVIVRILGQETNEVRGVTG